MRYFAFEPYADSERALRLNELVLFLVVRAVQNTLKWGSVEELCDIPTMLWKVQFLLETKVTESEHSERLRREAARNVSSLMGHLA